MSKACDQSIKMEALAAVMANASRSAGTSQGSGSHMKAFGPSASNFNSLATLLDEYSGQSIYVYLANLYGFCQSTSKKLEQVSLDQAQVQSEEEDQMQTQYTTDNNKAADDCHDTPNSYLGLSTKGMDTVIIAGTGTAVAGLIAAAITMSVLADAATATIIGAVIGVVLAVVAIALIIAAVTLMSIQAAENSHNNVDKHNPFSKDFWAGKREDGATSGSSWGLVETGTKSNIQQGAYKKDSGNANTDNTQIQDIQREIQQIMDTQYSQDQNNASSEQDSFNQVIQDMGKLTFLMS